MIEPKSEVFLMDCMEGMKQYPDKYFELAIVDPPYGIGEANEKRMQSRHYSQKKYKGGVWDNLAPDAEYFDLIKRKSKNQIIWGANHFIDNMPFNISSPCWIVWDKDCFGDFADCELAWTSFKTAVRKFKWTWNGFRKQMPEDRIHPTQNP
jgi:site-specific DNA-methyltransferase (adenine-specific)